MLSRFAIVFLSRSKCLPISRLQSLSTVILEPKKRKPVTGSTFSLSICHVVMGQESYLLGSNLFLGRKVMTNLDSIFKTRVITLSTKVRLVKAKVFPVVIYGCERWTIKKAEHWRTDAFELVLEKTFEYPLDSREIKPVNGKGNQPWLFIGRADAEAEDPIFGPPDSKSWLIAKDFDAGKDGGQEEKGATEDEMVRWHHWLNGHELSEL